MLKQCPQKAYQQTASDIDGNREIVFVVVKKRQLLHTIT